ncbi:DUF4129 domain-containing protein [Bacillus niameyensis]|uniref:DUF4129 domain-containing protein n=1 Tax=Bacillus niameyensis TaxID=1522308 RepID=UPI0007810DB5|nr:DUF4129 domain-containing protein [Bacillus niameyensis]
MIDPNDAREELTKILSKKEYQIYYNENVIQAWWRKAKDWLGEQLAKLFPSMETADKAAGPLLIAIIIIIIMLVILTVTLIIRNRMRNTKYRDRQVLHNAKEMEWSYQRHLSEAEKREDHGEYAEATRHMFLALLLYFHEKGWLEARIWKTNWEYYDELRKVNQTWADRFFNLANYFDEVTYGEYTVQKQEYEQFKTEVMKWLQIKTEAMGD